MSQPHNPSDPSVRLREVEPGDIPVFYEHQIDPLATTMAAFPSRDWDAFTAHWERNRANPSSLNRTIMVDDTVAGHIVSFEQDGQREVGYWLGREHWGQGIATRALDAFLTLEPTRPLYAHVVAHNHGSTRVLQKCGFTITSRHTAPDGLEELSLILAT